MPERRRRRTRRRYWNQYTRNVESGDGPMRRRVVAWVVPEDGRRLPYLAEFTVESYSRDAQANRTQKAMKLERSLKVNRFWGRVEQTTEMVASALDLGIEGLGDQLPDDFRHINPRILATALSLLRNISTQLRMRIFNRPESEIKEDIRSLKQRRRIIK